MVRQSLPHLTAYVRYIATAGRRPTQLLSRFDQAVSQSALIGWAKPRNHSTMPAKLLGSLLLDFRSSLSFAAKFGAKASRTETSSHAARLVKAFSGAPDGFIASKSTCVLQ